MILSVGYRYNAAAQWSDTDFPASSGLFRLAVRAQFGHAGDVATDGQGRVNGAVSEPHMRPKPIPVEAEPDAAKRKERIARRHTRRMHALRLGSALLPHPNQHVQEERCAGCGTEISNCTDGCRTCTERVIKRRNRQTATVVPIPTT